MLDTLPSDTLPSIIYSCYHILPYFPSSHHFLFSPHFLLLSFPASFLNYQQESELLHRLSVAGTTYNPLQSCVGCLKLREMHVRALEVLVVAGIRTTSLSESIMLTLYIYISILALPWTWSGKCQECHTGWVIMDGSIWSYSKVGSTITF